MLEAPDAVLELLSWVERHGITVDGFTGGSLPRPLGREKTMGFSISDEFELEYLPEPVDERALLALALMREGRALNHPAYAFLSFYRVLEVALPNGKKRGTWIDDHIEIVTDPRAKEAIASLRASGVAHRQSPLPHKSSSNCSCHGGAHCGSRRSIS
jgi:hypothetical protein